MANKSYLFVDGYNIINSWANLKQTMMNIGLDSAREELLDIMAEFQTISDEIVTVVFDAHELKGSFGSIEHYKGLTVIYTKECETADHYIERVLDKFSQKKHGRKNKIRVATSDGMIQQIVLGRGGIRVSAPELLAEYHSIKHSVNRFERKKSKNIKIKNIVSIDEDTLNKLESILDNNKDLN
ncbi:MAG: NYN domain-containing protein [Tissierellia bacterium]|nr:NYN domain-containing protein [Tissierellia bacterium]